VDCCTKMQSNVLNKKFHHLPVCTSTIFPPPATLCFLIFERQETFSLVNGWGGGGAGHVLLQHPGRLLSVFSCFVHCKNPSKGWSGQVVSRCPLSASNRTFCNCRTCGLQNVNVLFRKILFLPLQINRTSKRTHLASKSQCSGSVRLWYGSGTGDPFL
jgi:hypothetical protein